MLRRRALLPLAALALWACSERVEPAGGGATAATTTASREGLLHVGTARCVSCHAEEAASWAKSSSTASSWRTSAANASR